MYKSMLQVLCQKNSWGLPEYTVIKEGLDHNPKFSATVIVNRFPFHTTEDSRTAKEAQNKVAKLAFYSFSPPIPSPNPPPPSVSPAVPGTATQPSDARHLYKSRLQSFAQKRNLKIPEYSCQRKGPPHASRFRCSVTVDGKTYVGSEFHKTVKEAEHAAAKLAWDSLAANETQQEDCGLYKNLLQELAQKRGLRLPEYETIVSGPPHMPTFLSVVKVGGQSFQGEAAKGKKQAEMIAARVAYYGLINGLENNDGEKTVSNEPHVTKQPGSEIAILPVFPSEGAITEALNRTTAVQSVMATVSNQNGENNTGSENAILPVFPSEGAITEALNRSTAVQSVMATVSNQNGENNTGENESSSQTTPMKANAGSIRLSSPPAEADANAKRLRILPPHVNANDASVPVVASPSAPPNGSIKSNFDEQAGGPSHKHFEKIFVVPNLPSTTLPEGANVFPFSDDKWIIYNIDPAQS